VAYARLTDTFPFQMETVAAGNPAIGALCRCMAWSAGNRSDGFIPEKIARAIGSPKELDALAAQGLLDPAGFGEVRVATGRIGKKPDVRVVMPGDGYWMPRYLVHNLSALEDEALSEKGRRGGVASGQARSPERGSRDAGEPQVHPGVELQVEAVAEPTRQDKTRHRDKTRNQSNPAVKEDVGATYKAGGDRNSDRTAPSGGLVPAGQDDARASDEPLLSLDAYGEAVPL